MMSSKLVRRIVGSSVMARDEEHGACPARPRLFARLWRATACAHADRTFGWLAERRSDVRPRVRRTVTGHTRVSGACPVGVRGHSDASDVNRLARAWPL